MKKSLILFSLLFFISNVLMAQPVIPTEQAGTVKITYAVLGLVVGLVIGFFIGKSMSNKAN